MMIAQVDRHKVTDHVIPAGAAVASRLLFSVSAKTGSTDPHDEGQHRPISGSTARCAGLRSPDGEVLQRTADRSANTGAPGSIWAIPDQVEFDNGAAAWNVPHGNLDAEIIGTEGAIACLNNGMDFVLRTADPDARWARWRPERLDLRITGSATVACLEDLVEAHETGRPTLNPIAVAHHATEICLAVAESHRQGGRWVNLPLTDRGLYVHHV